MGGQNLVSRKIKWPFHSSREIKSAFHVSREKNGIVWHKLWELIFKKLRPKLSLVRCFYHPPASSSARSKTKSEQEHEEG